MDGSLCGSVICTVGLQAFHDRLDDLHVMEANPHHNTHDAKWLIDVLHSSTAAGIYHLNAQIRKMPLTEDADVFVVLVLDVLDDDLLVRLDLEQLQDEAQELGGLAGAACRGLQPNELMQPLLCPKAESNRA